MELTVRLREAGNKKREVREAQDRDKGSAEG